MSNIRFRLISFCLLLCLGCIEVNGQQTIGLFQNDPAALNGCVLWTVAQESYLIDNCGYEVNRWMHDTDPALSVYLTEQGELLRASKIDGVFSTAGVGGRIEKYDWDGVLSWTYEINNDSVQQHHDIEPLPNGNVLAIAWELISVDKAALAGSANPNIYWSEKVIEIAQTGPTSGEVVWEWRVWDHLVQDHDSSKENYGVISEHPELFDVNYEAPAGPGSSPDWLHFNGIDYDPLRDEIILSSRVFNEIYVIDHSTTTEEATGHAGGNRDRGGDLLYRWGNPIAYQSGVAEDQKFYGQHNAEIIPDQFAQGGGISVFNNGNDRPEGEYATVDIIMPPRDTQGNYLRDLGLAYGPTDLSWQYKATIPEEFGSKNMAGAHRLKNGNTFICEANKGRFFEVNLAGDILWTYQNPVASTGPMTQGSLALGGSTAFKAIKYPTDYSGLNPNDITPGDPIELDPINYSCSYNDNVIVDKTTVLEDIKVLQRGQSLRIENQGNYDHLDYQIMDISGRDIISDVLSNTSTEIDVSSLYRGIYVVYISHYNKYYTTKIFKN